MMAIALLYGLLTYRLTYRMVRTSATKRAKRMWAILVPIIMVLIPAGDVIAGRAVFSYLCETQAGTRIFRTVTLEPEFLHPDGRLKWHMVPGQAGIYLGERYRRFPSTERVMSWPRVERWRAEIRDLATGDVLGEWTTFSYWGGWLYHLLPGHHSGESCPPTHQQPSFEDSVFGFTKR